MPEEIFNINAKIVKLNNGYKMPIIGIGTYSLHGKACAEAVGAALKNGCRMIDTASFMVTRKMLQRRFGNQRFREKKFLSPRSYIQTSFSSRESHRAGA